jgi:hypothetical protein
MPILLVNAVWSRSVKKRGGCLPTLSARVLHVHRFNYSKKQKQKKSNTGTNRI